MKKNAIALFCLAAVLTLAPSFVTHPAAGDYGGAHVLFAGKFGGEIKKQELSAQTGITVEGCARGARVTGFTLAITRGGKTISLKSDAHLLTPEMRTRLAQLAKGDTFEFQNTRARMPGDGDLIKVQGGKFTVV